MVSNPRSSQALRFLSACGLAAAVHGVAFAGPTVHPSIQAERDAAAALGVVHADVTSLDIRGEPGQAFSVAVPLGGVMRVVDLAPHSVRDSGYQIWEQLANGALLPVAPSVERNFRGSVRGVDGTVAGALLEDGLHLMVSLSRGGTYFVEPIADRVDGLAADSHAVYHARDIVEHGKSCGNLGMEIGRNGVSDGNELARSIEPVSAFGTCIAQLGCDADFEYFQDYGSVTAVENRINLIINTVNNQYESQTGLTHQITGIIVRSNPNDPYTSTDAETRLCQFITEWTNNVTITRDVAHLFVGAELNGGTIGIASDIGGTGICVNNGGCSGGTFGTFGSYCISQSDFNGNFGCATDLTAHELGHLWGAFHCNCPGNTMNPSITCANNFSGGTIASITSYAATRTCLTGACDGPQAPDNDDCGDAIPITDGLTPFSTINATTDGPTNPAGQCNDSGQNQTHEDIWYTYVAPCDGNLLVTTCDDLGGFAGYDTDLVIYDGCNCNNLNLLQCNDDDGNNPCGQASPWASTLNVTVEEGNCYLIRVGGWNAGSEGDGELLVDGPDASLCGDGACCFPNGTCQQITASACAAAGGSYQGNGTNCGSANCPITLGACCFADGSCSIETASDCSSFGGSYQGNGVSCAAADCPQPTGACCFPNGTCAAFTEADCNALGGSYQGDNVTCGQANCPQPTGACCLGDGSCIIETAANCNAVGGDYQGDNVTCGAANCPQPTGACCLSNGSCVVLTAADCGNSGGSYQGDGVTCGAANCPQPTGACCFDDGSCIDATANDCAGLEGDYQGDDVTCQAANCQAVCPCDFNGDSTIDTSDLLFLLAQWGQIGGDCNGDGTTNTSDLLDLLANWGPC